MSINYGDQYVHANQVLSKTIIKLGDVPVYILNVCTVTGKVGFYNFEKYCRGIEDIQTAPLKAFDTTPFRMGYVNQDNTAVYSVRIPTRWYKQGMRRENVKSKNHKYEVDVFSKNFCDALNNIYPSAQEACEKLRKGAKSVAVSRHFALKIRENRSIIILYKGKRIGLYSRKSGKFLFLKNFYFLKENFNSQVTYAKS